MKRLFIVALGLLSIISLDAQTLSPQVVATSGTSFSNADAQLDQTIGEIVTSSFIGSDNGLTQGFHQPEILITSIENSGSDYTFSIYPNPTEQFVTVESDKEIEKKARIYDALGHEVMESERFTNTTTLDLQSLAVGSYFLVISSAAGYTLHSYTLIKN